MLPRRGEGGAFPGTVENREADFLVRDLNVVSQRGLRNIKVFGSPIEIQRLRQHKDAVDLFAVHNSVPPLGVVHFSVFRK